MNERVWETVMESESKRQVINELMSERLMESECEKVHEYERQ